MQLHAALTALDDESILTLYRHATGGLPRLTAMAAVSQQRGRYQVSVACWAVGCQPHQWLRDWRMLGLPAWLRWLCRQRHQQAELW